MSNLYSHLFDEVTHLLRHIDPYNLDIEHVSDYYNIIGPKILEPINNLNDEKIIEYFSENSYGFSIETARKDYNETTNSDHPISPDKAKQFTKGLFHIIEEYINYWENINNEEVHVHNGHSLEDWGEYLSEHLRVPLIKSDYKQLTFKEYQDYYLIETRGHYQDPLTLVLNGSSGFLLLMNDKRFEIPFDPENILFDSIQLLMVKESWNLLIPKPDPKKDLQHQLTDVLRDAPRYNDGNTDKVDLKFLLEKVPGLSMTFGLFVE